LDEYKKYYLYKDIIKLLSENEYFKNNFENNNIDIEELVDSFPYEFKKNYEKLNNYQESYKSDHVKYELEKKKYAHTNIKKKVEYFKDLEIFSDDIFKNFLIAKNGNDINENDKFIFRTSIINDQK
jgi:hypothetical protein